MEKVKFEEIADAMCMSVEEAEISFNLPMVIKELFEERAIKIGALLLKKTGVKGRVTIALTFDDRVVIYVESKDIQEVHFHFSELKGNRDAIVQKMSKTTLSTTDDV